MPKYLSEEWHKEYQRLWNDLLPDRPGTSARTQNKITGGPNGDEDYFWIIQDGPPALMAPTASLAVLIYNFSGMPFENQIEMAWAAALVLVLLVLTLNIIGQILSRRRV